MANYKRQKAGVLIRVSFFAFLEAEFIYDINENSLNSCQKCEDTFEKNNLLSLSHSLAYARGQISSSAKK